MRSMPGMIGYGCTHLTGHRDTAFDSEGSSSKDIDELKKENSALQSENASLKSEMQKELNRIKREVISINSQEIEKEKEVMTV